MINVVYLNGFVTLTLGLMAMVLGAALNQRVPLFNRYAIPAPVSGGALVALALFGIKAGLDLEVHVEHKVRDWALLYFFTSVGLNIRLDALRVGSRALLLLLGATLLYMCMQNGIGIGMAVLLEQPPVLGIIGGTASLIGGHGTAVAWAPHFDAKFGLSNALEMGTACATLGLILASVAGGVVGKYLIRRHGLATPIIAPVTSVAAQLSNACAPLAPLPVLYHCLLVQSLIGLAHLLHLALQPTRIQLPLFMACMLAGLLFNAVQGLLGRARAKPQAVCYTTLTGELSLGLLLAISLMGMDLQALVRDTAPLMAILALQVLVAVAYAVLVIYRLMGRNYEAAVVSSGFSGISLGATPTAMANMGVLARQYGHARQAFLIVPLVSACLIDLANALFINIFMLMH